jgi:hypothetical protein
VSDTIRRIHKYDTIRVELIKERTDATLHNKKHNEKHNETYSQGLLFYHMSMISVRTIGEGVFLPQRAHWKISNAP